MRYQNSIRYYRKSQGFSQDDLAFHFGVSRAIVSLWETGQMLPTREQLNGLAELLKVMPPQLYETRVLDFISQEAGA